MAATLEPFFRVNFGRHRQVTLYREWTKREQVLQEEQQLGIWREFKGRVDSFADSDVTPALLTNYRCPWNSKHR